MVLTIFMKHLISALLLSVLLFEGCQTDMENKIGAHKYINFVNNSDVNIFVSKAPYVPYDSLCYEIMQTYNNSQYTKILAHSNSNRPLGFYRYRKQTWETYLSGINSGTVIIFVHDVKKSDSICTDKNFNWQTMNETEEQAKYSYLNEQIIVKRYFCTLQDLERMDWTITYP